MDNNNVLAIYFLKSKKKNGMLNRGKFFSLKTAFQFSGAEIM